MIILQHNTGTEYQDDPADAHWPGNGENAKGARTKGLLSGDLEVT